MLPPLSQFAEKVHTVVIPNEVRNLSGFETQEKRDSSARSVPRNDNVLSFSASCSGGCALGSRVGLKADATSIRVVAAPVAGEVPKTPAQCS
jgi:hypothetical protein